MNDHRPDHPHDHGQDHSPGHGHTHGIVDPSITTSDRGLWAIKWSFVGLAATAMLQLFVVLISGSVALLADTIHNFGDAATAIPLAVAFWFARKTPSERFTFGYGRVEDLAGVAIVLTILVSAIIAGYESIERLLHPQDISYLWAVMAASIIGFLGNEAVAVFRIRIGREINSAALIADGYHARVDGWTSLRPAACDKTSANRTPAPANSIGMSDVICLTAMTAGVVDAAQTSVRMIRAANKTAKRKPRRSGA